MRGKLFFSSDGHILCARPTSAYYPNGSFFAHCAPRKSGETPEKRRAAAGRGKPAAAFAMLKRAQRLLLVLLLLLCILTASSAAFVDDIRQDDPHGEKDTKSNDPG